MNKQYIIIFYIILISCNKQDNENVYISKFPIVKTLNSKIIDSNIEIFNPISINIIGEQIVIFDKVDSGMFKVFDLPTFKFNYMWGNRGKGPDEFTFIDANYIRNFGDKLELVDNGYLKRIKIKNSSMELVESIKLPTSSDPVNNLQRINRSYYVKNSDIGDTKDEHVLIDIDQSRVLSKFGTYPSVFKTDKAHENYQLNYKFNTSIPEKQLFIVLYKYINLIKVYNTSNMVLKHRIHIKDKDFVLGQAKNENPWYFYVPVATKNYVFAYRMMKTQEEIVNDLDHFVPEILIFNSDFDPIASISLDKPVLNFAISEKRKKLYGVSQLLETNQIFIYDLKDIL